MRKLSGSKHFARIESKNNFPTGAGLASSASGLAALTIAAAKALSLDLSLSKLSEIARIGSGSACRSIFDGYVEWKRGELSDGTDSIAQTVLKAEDFQLDCTIVVIDAEKKHTLSTDGMIRTQETSPYFDSWVSFAHQSAQRIRKALLDKDFNTLANEVESNCINMHASAMAANPPILYWQPATIAVIKLIQKLRSIDSRDAFFTIDAGPNVVVFTKPEHTGHVRDALAKIEGITEILK